MAKSFSPNEYIKEHPHNVQIVKTIKNLIIKHINSCYSKGNMPVYSDWYVGISQDPENDRTKSHQATKSIKSLKNFDRFYAYGLANARKIEKELCNDFKLDSCHVIGGVTSESRWVYVYNLKLSPKK